MMLADPGDTRGRHRGHPRSRAYQAPTRPPPRSARFVPWERQGPGRHCPPAAARLHDRVTLVTRVTAPRRHGSRLHVTPHLTSPLLLGLVGAAVHGLRRPASTALGREWRSCVRVASIRARPAGQPRKTAPQPRRSTRRARGGAWFTPNTRPIGYATA